MNVLKAVFGKDVQPAMGCTEPGAIALACARAMWVVTNAAQAAGQKAADVLVEGVFVIINPSMLKNALGVTIPNTGGQKGCRIAAALGTVGGDQSLELQVLKSATLANLVTAQRMVASGQVRVDSDANLDDIYIKAVVSTSFGEGCVVTEGGHTNVSKVTFNGQPMASPWQTVETATNGNGKVTPKMLKSALSKMTISDLVSLAQSIDRDDRAYIQKGIVMNQDVAAAGQQLGKYGAALVAQQRDLLNSEDSRISLSTLIESSSALAACATDARMDGISLPVMSSGGSGNQGVVAILVPFNVGVLNGVDTKTVEESIALSHLINTYIKVWTGDLAPICGCAIAAGVGAAAAIVYQSGKLDRIGLAINTVIASIGGILCDGAKCGCTLKVLPSVSSCIQAAHFAVEGYGATSSDGIIGRTPEETIRNLGKLCTTGMQRMDGVVLQILSGKEN